LTTLPYRFNQTLPTKKSVAKNNPPKASQDAEAIAIKEAEELAQRERVAQLIRGKDPCENDAVDILIQPNPRYL
jgi:hypothetical protein